MSDAPPTTKPLCTHGHAYGTCLMCYHDLVSEQQSEIERLRALRADELQHMIRLRMALEKIARDERAAHQAWVSRSEETAREALMTCICGATSATSHQPDCPVTRPKTDLDLLREVSESWVNGRKVIDGIPKTIADQVRARFRWETQAMPAPETVDGTG